MQEAQKLMVDFNSYPAVFLRMVNSCIQTPQTHLAVLLMEQSGAARLDFIQVMKFVVDHAQDRRIATLKQSLKVVLGAVLFFPCTVIQHAASSDLYQNALVHAVLG